MQGDKRRRTRCVHAETGASQVEEVGDSVGNHAVCTSSLLLLIRSEMKTEEKRREIKRLPGRKA